MVPVGKAYTHYELLRRKAIREISDDLDLLDDEFNNELGINSD